MVARNPYVASLAGAVLIGVAAALLIVTRSWGAGAAGDPLKPDVGGWAHVIAVRLAHLGRPDSSWLEVREDQRQLVGTRCRVHPDVALELDIVRTHYGIMGIGFGAAQSDSFPNAGLWANEGCVIQPQTHAEIAYCSKCRDAFMRWRNGAGRRW